MSTIHWLGQHLDNVHRSLVGPTFKQCLPLSDWANIQTMSTVYWLGQHLDNVCHSLVGLTFRQCLPFTGWTNI